MTRYLLAIAAAWSFWGIGLLEAREWRDVSGEYSREADFVAHRGERVWLRAGESTLSIAWGQLSEADRAYVTQLESGKSQADPFLPAASSDATMLQTVMKMAAGESVENLPEPTSANYAAAMMQAADGLAFHPPDATVAPKKYVYFARRSTTHLLDFAPKQGIGTIHYCLQRHQHPCGWCGKWYLALLYKMNEDSKFFYYRPLYGDPKIDWWAFSRRQDCYGCKHSIWIHTSDGWRQVDCADRVHPS